MAKSRKRHHKSGGQNRNSNNNNSNDVLSPSSFQPLNMFFNRNGGYEAIPTVREHLLIKHTATHHRKEMIKNIIESSRLTTC
jgi:hypothetical protein